LREFGPFGPHWRPERPERVSGDRNPREQGCVTASGHGGRHGLDADDVERAAQIIGERGQAELGAHVGEARASRKRRGASTA
jgi:hypothetical protein